MSNEAQGLVRNLAMDAPHKPILLAYANYADEAGYCWPGVETIAFDIGYSVPTVVRTRRELIKANWMRSKRQFGTSATTRLNLPKIATAGIDRGDRAKLRPEFEFEDETAGQDRTDHSDLNDETAGQDRTDHSDLTDQITVISTRDHSDHLSLRDSSVDPSVDARGERGSESAPQQPPEWALRLVADLDFGRFRRPTHKRARAMARKLQHAHDAVGLGERELARHCRAALNEATTNGVAYLDTALDADNLPLPRTAATAPEATGPRQSDTPRASETTQSEAMANIRDHLNGPKGHTTAAESAALGRNSDARSDHPRAKCRDL